MPLSGFKCGDCHGEPCTGFISSFHFYPVGIWNSTKDLQVVTSFSTETKIICDCDPYGNVHFDSANSGAVIVDSATESRNTIWFYDGGHVSAGSVIVYGDVEV